MLYLYMSNLKAKTMIEYELLINAKYWILTGTNDPIEVTYEGKNPYSNNGLFHYSESRLYPICRKYSEVFRTKEDAIKSLNK
jgi:hypothetical protein